MAKSDHPPGTTAGPLHAVWTVLEDGSPNPSVGVVFDQVLPSGVSHRRIDVEVPLEDGELEQPWGKVCAAVVTRALAAEGLELAHTP